MLTGHIPSVSDDGHAKSALKWKSKKRKTASNSVSQHFEGELHSEQLGQEYRRERSYP